MTDKSNSNIFVYPYDANLLRISAQKIIHDNANNLPDLTATVVLLPNYHVANRMRSELVQTANVAGSNAIIGPRLYLLRDYILKSTLLNVTQIPVLASELLIINALKDNSSLFGNNNTLTSSYALFDLINLLTRHQVVLPTNIHAFKQQLINAYQTQSKTFDALSQEAQLIYTIWQAWHTQLDALKQIDKDSLYQLKLGESLKQSPSEKLYLLGNQQFLPSELAWIKKKLQLNQLTFFLQSELEHEKQHPDAFIQQTLRKLNRPTTNTQSDSSHSRFLSMVYQRHAPLLKRVDNAKSLYSQSPIKHRISVYHGTSFENEAQAIQIQIQRWLQAGKKDIALILEDRRLARRVRALLERYGIGVQDAEGWALSTSAAASIIEGLLEAVEENFNHTALLTLLKSPFVFSQNTDHASAIARFEQEILPYENVYGDLDRYKNAIESRQKRLNILDDEINSILITMLEDIEQATRMLAELHTSNNANVNTFARAIISALKVLGVQEKFTTDVAGEAILSLLQEIVTATQSFDSQLNWIELRQWLGRKLEEKTFSVQSQCKTQIKLFHLNESNLTQHDAIIIGNMVRESYPGSGTRTPFFNQQVYKELGLPGITEQMEEKYFYYRRLLDAADNILLSYHKGEHEAQMSPWLELLTKFHQLTYNDELIDETLVKLVQTEQNILPSQHAAQETPQIHVNESQLPKRISASAHQTLINCPYAYHMSEVLKLRAPEEIRQTLAKNDYGERIHFILFLFHQGNNQDYPPPFKESINADNKSAALVRMTEISQIVFQKDLEDNFQHRSWFKRWLSCIPAYIDWLEQDQLHWNFEAGEINATNKLANGLEAYGRIDRQDKARDKKRIIDYKTGGYPSADDVLSGESVQLVHYALASKEKIDELGYLSLENKNKKLAPDIILEEEQLAEIKIAVEKRLSDIKQQLENRVPLNAWGDEQTCDYCAYDGICRARIE